MALPAGAGEPVQQTPTKEAPCGPYPGEADNRPHSKVIDKSLLALPEPRRVRDRDHVKSVAKQPCLICGRQPADAHHVRFAQNRAVGRKVSDEFTVPLCRGHHRELHRCGDEAAWWKKVGIDPTVCARTLWLASHPHPLTTCQPVATSPDVDSTRTCPVLIAHHLSASVCCCCWRCGACGQRLFVLSTNPQGLLRRRVEAGHAASLDGSASIRTPSLV